MISSLSKRILFFILTSLIVLFVFRLGLISYHYARIDSLNDVFYMLAQGTRVDLVLMGYLYLIPFLISLFLNANKISQAIGFVLKIWIVLVFTVCMFMEVMTPEFIAEYDVRPNRLFVEYLQYPAEVSNMLITGYKAAIALGLSALFFTAYWAFKQINKSKVLTTHTSFKSNLTFCFIAILVGFLAIRSSLQHRPFNPSMVYFSNDNLVNSLVLNSTYSVMFAIYNMQNEKNVKDMYGKMPEAEIISHIKAEMNVAAEEFVSDEYPTRAKHTASYEGKPKNIVILLQESLGSRYVGTKDDRPQSLTPHLDKLSEEAWVFENIYATGTRSVRGIEAVTTGFNPTPARAVVKLDKSQTGFYTIAETLAEQGYQTQFIYGGESHFDNMKSFFLGNGFQLIHDLPKFKKPGFIGSWGASDEDLYNEAHEQFIQLNQEEKPFFSLVFTSSNHSPFEFPEGCVEPIGDVRETSENTIRYSDCAFGRFLAKAKQADYWKNTLFLFVADHDSRAFGTSIVPIEHFDIPAVIFGEGIEPRVDTRLVSQLDLPQTMLSLAGISSINPMTGFDLSKDIPLEKERALMQYQQNFAWMTHDLITVFLPGEQIKAFKHDGQHVLDEIQITEELEKNLVTPAKAQALWGGLAYSKSLFSYQAAE